MPLPWHSSCLLCRACRPSCRASVWIPSLGSPHLAARARASCPLCRAYAVLGLLGLIAVGAVLMRPGATAAAEPVAAEDVVGLAEMVVKPAFEKCSVRAEKLRGLEVLRGVRLGRLSRSAP